jgi:hypothetical protein
MEVRKMRNLVRIILAVVFATISIAAIGGVASAAPTGSIAGYVYKADGVTPVAGAYVGAHDSTTGGWVEGSYTSASGAYIIDGLSSGSYRVRASAPGYIPEWYDEVSTFESATTVSVSAPNETSGIDFTLTPASSISGHVYHTDGTTPLPGASVAVYEDVSVPGTWMWLAEGYSGADGSYSITTGTGAGTYRVKAEAKGEAAKYYNNASDPAASTPVAVAAGQDTPNINFTLAHIGCITGTLYEPDGVTPLKTGSIQAYNSTTGDWVNYGSSNEDTGEYYINLPPGTYRLMGEAKGYAAEYYTNASDFASATPVSVNGLNQTPGINFIMAQIGYISGTVYKANGVTPLATAHISAYNSATGDWVNDGRSAPITGSYYINLPEGTYRLIAQAAGYITQWYWNQSTYDEATPVSVSGVNEAPSKNFVLKTPLAVTTNPAIIVTGTSARLNGYLTSPGAATSVTVSFVWGITVGGPYPNKTSDKVTTAAGAFSADVGNLAADTKYYYRAKAVGESTIYGAEESFTIDVSAPVISSPGASNITVSGVTIAWTTNEPAISQVEYGLTEEYGLFTDWDSNLVNSHSVDLTGLKAGKTYHYRVISKDAAGNRAESEDGTFTTAGRSGGIPTWAWVVIGLLAVGVAGGAVYLIRGWAANK